MGVSEEFADRRVLPLEGGTVDLRPDLELMDESLAGDLEAFAELYERYRPAILKLTARRLRDPMLAEDALQEAFLAAYTHLATFDRSRHFFPWVASIALHLAERIGRRHVREFRIVESEPVGISAEDSALGSIEMERLLAALHALPERRRRAMWLHDVAGWSTSEVAQHEGTSELAIRSMLCRARATIRERLAAGLAAILGLFRRSRRRVEHRVAEMERLDILGPFSVGAQSIVNVACTIVVLLGVSAPIAASASVSAHTSVERRSSFWNSETVAEETIVTGNRGHSATTGEEGPLHASVKTPSKHDDRVAPPGGEIDIAIVGPDGQVIAGADTWLACTGVGTNAIPQDGPVTGFC